MVVNLYNLFWGRADPTDLALNYLTPLRTLSLSQSFLPSPGANDPFSIFSLLVRSNTIGFEDLWRFKAKSLAYLICGALTKLGLGGHVHTRHLVAGSLSTALGIVSGREPGRLASAVRLPGPDTGGQACRSGVTADDPCLLLLTRHPWIL